MVNTCTIDGVDMYETYGLYLASKEIAPPTPKTNLIDVPSRDGSIDLSELVSGRVNYENREITLTFLYLGDFRTANISKVYEFLHGKRKKIIFSDDLSFYYEGRFSCSGLEELQHGDKYTISLSADPYKYDINGVDDMWEWDSFDFELGVLNDFGEVVIDGESSITVTALRKTEYPTIIVSDITSEDTPTVTFNDVAYVLQEGSNKLYQIVFEEGDNVLKFSGNYTVSLSIKGGML